MIFASYVSQLNIYPVSRPNNQKMGKKCNTYEFL